jgi:hypothetical protein
MLAGSWLMGAPGLRAQTPLPDRETFFAEVRKRLAGNDELQSRFSFRERSTELSLNPFGRMGTGDALLHEVYPHPNAELTYRRLIERNGRRVPPAEVARRDRDQLEKVRRWEQAMLREGQSARQVRLRKAEEARARDQAQAREALDLFHFTMEGRETIEGEPAIVVAFAPRHGARPRSREGTIAHVFAGRAWIHEHDHEVMQVEAQATRDVSFGLGVIARLHEGSTASFTRRRIHGTWLPVESRFEGTGRALLFRRITIDFVRSYFDYRPWDPAELGARLKN